MKAKIIIMVICLLISAVFFLRISFEKEKLHQDNPEGNLPGSNPRITLQTPESALTDAALVAATDFPSVKKEGIAPLVTPIKGVETSVAGFLGQTESGPVEPQLVTSFSQFESLYGRYTDSSYLPYSVKGFFDNGGHKLYIARTVSALATAASTYAAIYSP